MHRLLSTLLLLNASSALAAAVHSWTDEHGIRHFSDRPSALYSTQAQPLPSAPSPGPSQQRRDNTAQRAAAEQRHFNDVLRRDAFREEQARQQRCRTLEEQLAMLRDRPRLRLADAAGSPRPLDEAEREVLIRDTRERLRISCPR